MSDWCYIERVNGWWELWYYADGRRVTLEANTKDWLLDYARRKGFCVIEV